MRPQPEPGIRIASPCPKRWEELVGDERRRYCSECSLHVLDAAQLTRREARELVESSESRVCMRIEYDPSGLPIHRTPIATRLARWALGAGTALLAACQGGSKPAPAAPVPPTTRTGQVVVPAQEMGKVRLRSTLGEAVVPSQPPPDKPK